MIDVICSSPSATSRPSGARIANTSDCPMPVAMRARISTVSCPAESLVVVTDACAGGE